MTRVVLFIFLWAVSAFAHADSELFAKLTHLRQHVNQRFQEAEVETYPFPHLVVTEVFPDWFYQEMLSHVPDATYFDRAVFPMALGSVKHSRLSQEEQQFWAIFADVVVNRYVKPKVIAQLAPHFPLKLYMTNFDPARLNTIEHFTALPSDGLHIQDVLAPHIDSWDRFAQLLFPLHKNPAEGDDGVCLFEGNACLRSGCCEGTRVWLAKQIRWNPNSLIVLLQTPRSWYEIRNEGGHLFYEGPISLSLEFLEDRYRIGYAESLSDAYYRCQGCHSRD